MARRSKNFLPKGLTMFFMASLLLFIYAPTNALLINPQTNALSGQTNGMIKLKMFQPANGIINKTEGYSSVYYVSTGDLQAVIDGGVAIRIILEEPQGNPDVAISQTTSKPEFNPNEQITMQGFTWWMPEGWIDISNDGSSVCVSQSSRSTRGQSCLAAIALPLYMRVHCPATSTVDCKYKLKIEYTCRKGWYGSSNTYCSPCPAGKYSNIEAAQSCIDCEYDKFSVAGATSCDYKNNTCPTGTYSQTRNACVSCSAGKYQPNIGMLSPHNCLSCGRGKYSSKVRASLASDCLDCQQGKWSDTIGAGNESFCTVCSFGQYNLQPGSTGCLDCEKGTYLADDKTMASNHDERSDCLTCPKGYYSEARSRYCTRCPAGKETGTATGSASATDCKDCPAGKRGIKHYNDSLPSQCLDCEPGYYQNKTGMTICIPCMPGKASDNVAEDHSCTTCSAGRFSTTIAALTCTNCSKGQYVPRENSPFCLTCKYGKYQDVVGSTSCKHCPAGRKNDDVSTNNQLHDSLDDCQSCLPGKYQPLQGRSVCHDCPPGTYSEKNGSSFCSLCQAGYASATPAATSNTTCRLCQSGYYESHTASQKCKECDKGKHGDANLVGLRTNAATSCLDCPAGFFMNHRAAKDVTTCYACPQGKWSDVPRSTSITACQDCDAGKFSSAYGASSRSYCTNCTSGKYQNATGSPSCKPCGKGKHGAANIANDMRIDEAISCKHCPTGRYSDLLASPTLDKCSLCPLGRVHSKVGVTSGSDCVDCQAGFYSDIEGGDICKRCANGTTNNVTGSDGCSPCLAGYYLDTTNSNLSICVACEPGKYSLSGASQCVSCEAGKYTALNDQTKCVACPEGKYSDKVQQVGSSICENCPASRFSTYKGASSINYCIFCSPGKYNNISTGNTALTDCKDCEIGKYTKSKGSLYCKTCDVLKTTFSTGATSCRFCESGKVLNGTVCIRCNPGSYSTKGMSVCVDCVAGRFSSAKLDACHACSRGTWSDTIRAQSNMTCRMCPNGTYSNAIGASSLAHCNKCPAGKASASLGATTLDVCIDCAIGFYGSSEGLDQCLKCTNNMTTFKNGSTQCSFCPAGTEFTVKSLKKVIHTQHSPTHISTRTYYMTRESCTNCPPGFVSTGNNGRACTICPSGTYNNSINTICLKCPRGTYQNLTGQASKNACIKCERGRYGLRQGENRKFNATNDEGCTRCDVGKQSNVEGAPNSNYCKNCLAGFYAKTLGSTSCERCNGGKYSLDGANFCETCHAGSYNNSENTKCVLCDQGKWSSTVGATSQNTCISCAPGKFSPMYGRRNECTNCSIGRYNSNAGSIFYGSCQVCNEKSYQDEEGSVICKQCPPPLTNTKKGSASCSPCKSGRAYSNITKECLSCPADEYSLDGDTTCRKCMKGTYRNFLGTGCLLCKPGFYQDQIGATNASQCLPCPKGTFSSALGLISSSGCQKCPFGTASRETNATSSSTCIPCPLNYFADTQGQTDCKVCDAGKATRSVGSITCERCRPGEFMHNNSINGNLVCKKCDSGQYSYGATSKCYDCPSGRYNNTDNTACHPCPVGRWSDTLAASSESTCKKCLAGSYNQIVGASASSDCLKCPKGRFGNTTGADSLDDCIKCRINWYSDVDGSTSCKPCSTKGSGMMNEKEGSAVCYGCASGSFLNQATRKCESCQNGHFSTYGSTQCNICSAGKFSNGNKTKCIDCPVGKWSSAVAANSITTCNACPQGTYNNGIGGKDLTYCNKCPSGKSSNQTGASSLVSCIDCPIQYYAAKDGMISCKKCPSLKTTFKEGSSECFFCPAGKFLMGSACRQCDSGKWSDGTFSVCKSCKAGYYNNTQNTGCIACSPGRYSEVNGADSPSICTSCLPGKFGGAAGANNRAMCTDCPLGRAHNFTGMTSLGDCQKCAVGYYAPIEGMASCLECERLKQNSVTGSTSCDYCPAGQYIDEVALPAPKCEKCLPGFYSFSGSNKCTMCEAGKYSDRQINCVPCDPGYYSNRTAASNISTCTPCPRGKFNSMDGSSSIHSCTACPAGRVLNVLAAVSLHQCLRCDIGKYTATPGQTKCVNCPPKKTNTEVGSSTCEFCDGGQFLNGTVVCVDCAEGRYSKKGDGECSKCVPGFYSAKGQTECKACERGKSKNLFGASLCDDCSKGKFQDVRGKTSCENCPIDTYNNKIGVKYQEHCTRCASRRTTNGTDGHVNETACICRKGFVVEYNEPGHCPPDTLESGCFLCPEGGNCTNVALPISGVISRCGFWRRNASSCKLYQCGDHSANDCSTSSRCVGGIVNGNQDSDNVFDRDQCRQNHTGPLCGACKENYRLSDNGFCFGCVKPPENLFQYMLFAMLIIFLGILAIQLEISAFYFFAFTSTRHVSSENRRQTCWAHFLDARERGEWVRIMMNYFQIVSYIDIVFEIKWPNNFAWVPRYMRMFSSFDVTSWIHTFNWCLKFLPSVQYHSIIVTCMMVFVIIVVWVLKRCCKKNTPLRKGDEKAKSIVQVNLNYVKDNFHKIQNTYATFVRSAFYMFSLMHCGLVARSFQVYRCDVSLEPYENYMNADYAVRCHDPFTAWGASAALATTMLFTIGLGIPVYLAFRLRAYDIFVRSITLKKKELAQYIGNSFSGKRRSRMGELASREFRRRKEFELRLKKAAKEAKEHYLVANIYSLYREGFYWWELVELVKSAIMTGCLILLRPGSFLQHVAGTMLLLLHLASVTIVKPYKHAQDNNVQFILSSVLVVTLPATAAVHRAKDAEEREGMLNYVIGLNVAIFTMAFILRAREDMQLKEKDATTRVHPANPRGQPMGKRKAKKLDDLQGVSPNPKGFTLDDDDNSVDSKSSDDILETKTPGKKLLPPLQRNPPSFRGFGRVKTLRRKQIAKELEYLGQFDLDGDGEIEASEVISKLTASGMSEKEAHKKVEELLKKFDIDGDGAFSLQEAYITEAEAALEEEEQEATHKKQEELQAQREKQKRSIEERVKRRHKKLENKAAEKEQENLKVGDSVEVRVDEAANPIQAKIVAFHHATNTYDVNFRGMEGGMNGLRRKQLKLLPAGFGGSTSGRKDRRKIPTKTMRSTNPAEAGDRRMKEEYLRRAKMRVQEESDAESSESSDVI